MKTTKLILSLVVVATLSSSAFAAETDAEIAAKITGDNNMVINNITCESGATGYKITIVNPKIKTQELKYNSCTSSKIEWGQPLRVDTGYVYYASGDSVILSAQSGANGEVYEFMVDSETLAEMQGDGQLSGGFGIVAADNTSITVDETGTRFYYNGELIEGEGTNYYQAPEGHDYPSSVSTSSDYSEVYVTNSEGETYTIPYLDAQVIQTYGSDMDYLAKAKVSFLNGELYVNGEKYTN